MLILSFSNRFKTNNPRSKFSCKSYSYVITSGIARARSNVIVIKNIYIYIYIYIYVIVMSRISF